MNPLATPPARERARNRGKAVLPVTLLSFVVLMLLALLLIRDSKKNGAPAEPDNTGGSASRSGPDLQNASIPNRASLPRPRPAGEKDHRVRSPVGALADCLKIPDESGFLDCIREHSKGVSIKDSVALFCKQGSPPSRVAAVLKELMLASSDPKELLASLEFIDGACDVFRGSSEVIAQILLDISTRYPAWYVNFLHTIDADSALGECHGKYVVLLAGILLAKGESTLADFVEAAARGESGATDEQMTQAILIRSWANLDAGEVQEFLQDVLGSPAIDKHPAAAGMVANVLLRPASWPSGDPKPSLDLLHSMLREKAFRVSVAASILQAHSATAPQGISKQQWERLRSSVDRVASETGLVVH